MSKLNPTISITVQRDSFVVTSGHEDFRFSAPADMAAHVRRWALYLQTEIRHQKAPATLRELVRLWPSIEDFAIALHVRHPSHIHVMFLRNAIPVWYWPSIISSAKEHAIDGITADLLLKLHTDAARSAPDAETLLASI